MYSKFLDGKKVDDYNESEIMNKALDSGASSLFKNYIRWSNDYAYLFKSLANSLDKYVNKGKSVFVYFKVYDKTHTKNYEYYLVTDLKDLVTEKDNGSGLAKVKERGYTVISFEDYIDSICLG